MVQNTGLIVAVVLAALAVLIQATAMLGIWLTIRQIPGQIKSAQADFKQRIDPLTQSVMEIVNNSREPVRIISANLTEISHILRNRAAEVDTLAADLAEKSREQATRIDQMVTGLVDKVDV